MADSRLISPPDWEERRLIDSLLETSMLVEAAAGTGKTTKMVDRMVALVRSGRAKVENMAAVTFTRKAASELRARFQAGLEAEARVNRSGVEGRHLAEGVAQLDRCFIGTIHAFCARILRERPVEAGVSVDFQEIDEEADSRIREQAWEDYVAGLYVDSAPILDELNELGIEIGPIKAAFDVLCNYPDVENWPAPKLAPPDPEPLKSGLLGYAHHMEELAESLPADPGNDRLIPKYEIIPRMVRQSDLSSLPRLAEVAQAFRPLKGSDLVRRNWPGGKDQAEGEWMRWETFCTERAGPFLAAWRSYCYEPVIRALRPAMEVYDRLRAGYGMLNYQDLLVKARLLLQHHPNVRSYFSRRVTHLLVDEFQDTDPVQAEVMLLLTADDPGQPDWTKCRPRPGALFVVGDPKQSIYRFRRADIVTYNQVKELILAAGGRVVRLSANFRAQSGLIQWVNNTFSDKFQNDRYSPAYVALEAARTDCGPVGPGGVYRLDVPKEYKNKDNVAEYEPGFVASWIRQALDEKTRIPRPAAIEPADQLEREQAGADDFLIITYRKKNLDLYAAKLEELGIPHQVTGSGALEGVRELRLLYLWLAAVIRPDNPLPLVALLRSASFGVSDIDLYAFKKAGGTFSYRSPVPRTLKPGQKKLFEDAFSRLAEYSAWIAKLPPVTAIRKIASDAGLFASAAAGSGGNMRAGTLAKALELLRASQYGSLTMSDLVDYLGRLASGEISSDSLPAAPGQGPAVRLMNLHKVKGLEAPVVFLVDPFGRGRHEVRLHIDRSGGCTAGYLAICAEGPGRYSELVAHHPEWQKWAGEEAKFLEAEEVRLFYVAATRAGAQLVITQRETGKQYNPWNFFEEHLKECPALEKPVKREVPLSREETAILESEPQSALEAVRQRWTRALEPGYSILRAKEVAVGGIGPQGATGELGLEWGTVIHRLLQAALESTGSDLKGLVRDVLKEQELDPELEAEALKVVDAVTRSDIWRRALSSEKYLTEVPFELLDPTSCIESGKTILRGVIDLVFREPGGWVIVDYKTDRPSGDLTPLVGHYAPQVRLYASAWGKATGEAVKETGLYFTAADRYIEV
ncbi:MAG TPA: UvrD-helicase domain-containing protein [archaeon]|nr:UvrD-helicase domain-containing protein [archaeon]